MSRRYSHLPLTLSWMAEAGPRALRVAGGPDGQSRWREPLGVPALLERYWSSLLAYTAEVVESPDSAETVVQETSPSQHCGRGPRSSLGRATQYLWRHAELFTRAKPDLSYGGTRRCLRMTATYTRG